MCLEAKEKFKVKVGTIINNEITTIDDSNYFYIECQAKYSYKFYLYLYQYILDSQ